MQADFVRSVSPFMNMYISILTLHISMGSEGKEGHG